jgi:hypothetical protein
MIGFKDYWYGKECEGRLTDVETLFIADLQAFWEQESIPGGTTSPHIYFCSGATEQIINGHDHYDWEWLDEYIGKWNKIITLEVTPGMLEKIPAMIRIKVHIMYMMNEKDVRLLKKNDSIKVVYDDYSLYCASVQNMQHVTPDDYKHDRIE